MNDKYLTGLEGIQGEIEEGLIGYTKGWAHLERIEARFDSIESKLDKLLEAKKPRVRVYLQPDLHFNEFWHKYPLKKGKKAALSAFNRANVDFDALIADVANRLANDRQWIAGYIPHAATYLNGERWNDSIEAIPTKAETLPKDDNKVQAWAANSGHRQALPGESISAYRRYLQNKLNGDKT